MRKLKKLMLTWMLDTTLKPTTPYNRTTITVSEELLNRLHKLKFHPKIRIEDIIAFLLDFFLKELEDESDVKGEVSGGEIEWLMAE